MHYERSYRVDMVVLQLAVLALLLVTAALGLLALRRWWGRRGAGFPSGRIATHISLQLVSIGLWTAFALSDLLVLAWTAFAVITVGQVFGDLLMFASYRARRRVEGAVPYRAVARDVLGFSRPVAALHAVIGATGYFAMLAACIWASVG